MGLTATHGDEKRLLSSNYGLMEARSSSFSSRASDLPAASCGRNERAFGLYPRWFSRDVGYRRTSPQASGGATTPYGCPMFASAYVRRKRWAKPSTAFCSLVLHRLRRPTAHKTGVPQDRGSAVERSAVQRSFRGNVFQESEVDFCHSLRKPA
jgi:hypothetical protein